MANNNEEKLYTFQYDMGEGRQPKVVQVKESELSHEQFQLLLGELRTTFNKVPKAVKYLFLDELHSALPDTSSVKKQVKEIHEGQVLPHEKLKEFEIWMEGFADSKNIGSGQQAQFLGKVSAHNFRQACHMVMCKNYLEAAGRENKSTHEGAVFSTNWDYDPVRMEYWALRLFDNEADARKRNG